MTKRLIKKPEPLEKEERIETMEELLGEHKKSIDVAFAEWDRAYIDAYTTLHKKSKKLYEVP